MRFRGLLALLAWLVLLLAPGPAQASPPSAWTGAVVPLRPRDDHASALVALAPPSNEHPLGTVAIFGQNVSDVTDDASALVLLAHAWDLATQKVIATKRIASLTDTNSAFTAVRDGDRILLVVAGQGKPAAVTLFTLDESLEVLSRDELGRGQTPSLAISDRWIVAGFFEERTTDVPPPPAPQAFPMHLGFHAVTLDRVSHTVVGARIFQGTRLFYPSIDARLSTHAIAMLGDVAYLSLPGASQAFVIEAKLPSLAPRASLLLDGFLVNSGSAPIHAVDDKLVVLTPLGFRVLTRQLALVPQKIENHTLTLAWNAKRSILFGMGRRATGVPWSWIGVAEVECEQTIWAWDQPVALCGGNEGYAIPDSAVTPIRLFRRR
ncbi:hypothetical protein BH11MYX4_BH11MYX4_09060 [soil metagenome]